MPPPSKSIKQNNHAKDSDSPDNHSNNLWVGNLTSDVTDSDLKTLFEKHGAIDSVTLYSSRSYAFVYFKRVEDAKAAKNALQGTVLHGKTIKIEFAKPAKPCKSLWVCGIGPSVSKEELEEQFLKFGEIEDFKFLRDRNSAFVDYFRLEDASQSVKSMNGKQIGENQIRVDFLRSQPSRREQWPDFLDAREGPFFNRSMGPPIPPWMPQDFVENYLEHSHYGSKRQQHSQSSGRRKGDGQPSNVLRISYPPSSHIDEQMLHNAMILFGEIESIRSVLPRHCSFVEFRSVEEAQRAKEGLQGRLFNDPRISIMYSGGDLASSKDYLGIYSGIGPRPDMFSSDRPFQPAQVDIFSLNHPMVPNSFPGPLPPHGIPGHNMPMRLSVPQGSFKPALPGPGFSALAKLHKLQDTNLNTIMGDPNWSRSSPTPGRLSPPSQGVRPSIRHISDTWDVFDASQLQREAKRLRTDGALPAMDPSFPLEKIDDQGLGLDQFYGLGRQVDGGASGPLANVQGKNHLRSADARVTAGGTSQGHPELDYIWRGIIAKGGTPVCRARCVSIGEGIGSSIPEVVNCSARTGLDMLTKHYADAVGFGIIFFLPDSEVDFAPYTEFLQYLGARNRAGVAKFDDGTTLFLVPPSDFLAKVLNVAGPERLYGVVLKFSQHALSSTSKHPESFQPQYIAGEKIPLQNDYGLMPQEERVLQIDYNRVSHKDSKPPPKSLGPPTIGSLSVHPVAHINTANQSQAGLTLTPELIASLASLLPAKENLFSTQPPFGSSTLRPVLTTTAASDRGLPQGWKPEREAAENTGHPLQQVHSQFNPQAQLLSQLQAYQTISNTPSDLAQGITGNTHIEDPIINMPRQRAVSSRPSTNLPNPSQSGPFAVSPQVNQQYHIEIPQNAFNGNGMTNGVDAFGLNNSSVLRMATNPVTSSNQIHGANISPLHSVVAVAAEKSNLELPNQVQQLQSVPYGAGQGTSDAEGDKNERYRSTLQFAASLLLQIQQQQPGTQAGQGSVNANEISFI